MYQCPCPRVERPDGAWCAYPGCLAERRSGADLCSKYHGGKWSPNGAKPDPMLVENDGIVDPEAIYIAVTGERPVKMTWIERDIATMMILAAGHSYYEAAIRTGMPVTGEHDPKLRGARFRRLVALGRKHYGIDGCCAA